MIKEYRSKLTGLKKCMNFYKIHDKHIDTTISKWKTVSDNIWNSLKYKTRTTKNAIMRYIPKPDTFKHDKND